MSYPNRISVGKIIDKDLGLIQPNSNYAQLFPDQIELSLNRSDTLSVLPYLAMIEEAKLIGLYDPLKKHFPDQFLPILALVLFTLCESNR